MWEDAHRLYANTEFYIRDLSIHGFWCGAVLDPIPCGVQGTTVLFQRGSEITKLLFSF